MEANEKEPPMAALFGAETNSLAPLSTKRIGLQTICYTVEGEKIFGILTETSIRIKLKKECFEQTITML